MFIHLKIKTTLHTEKPSLVCFDGNITAKTMATIAETSVQLGIPGNSRYDNSSSF